MWLVLIKSIMVRICKCVHKLEINNLFKQTALTSSKYIMIDADTAELLTSWQDRRTNRCLSASHIYIVKILHSTTKQCTTSVGNLQ